MKNTTNKNSNLMMSRKKTQPHVIMRQRRTTQCDFGAEEKTKKNRNFAKI